MASNTLRERVQEVREAMAKAATRSGRDVSDIQLIAVSKKKPVSLMREYQEVALDLGIVPVFGENYVQECAEKRTALAPDTVIHCLGPLQSNKAEQALSLFNVIQTGHSDKILYLLNRYATEARVKKEILLEINVSGDSAKHGFPPGDLPRVLDEVLPLCPTLVLRGLMTITREYDNVEDVRPDFARLRETAASCNMAKYCLNGRVELSMGMSADFSIAIEEGATMVRVGTAIFGERS